MRPSGLADVTTDELQASGFAVVTGQVNAAWADGQLLAEGALVPAGSMELEQGMAQIELFSGVTVVVEAPAVFEIVSSMEMTITEGRVRAHVPEPAHGFRIRTEDGEIVDLGTEFGVSVSAGQSEVHVLEGEIEWHPRATSAARRMKEGEAVRTQSSTGSTSDLSARAAEFVGVVEMRDRLVSSRTSRHERWKRHSEVLRGDPRLVAYYQTTAGEDWNRRIPNLAVKGAAGEGAVVAAVRATDRWGRADGALDFSPTGSRVRVNVPGEYRSLTFLCWVKLNSLDRWYNSLFLTDGHEQHEPHWQIMDDGRLFFSVKKRDQWDSKKGERDKHIFYSPSFWSSSLSGQWLMITTVYDVDARLVTHYLNGERLSSEAIPEEYLVESATIGNASLANWGLPERNEARFAVRNLNGSMDEFMLFNSALAPEEIRQLYDNGKP